jgi:hypothetical protein
MTCAEFRQALEAARRRDEREWYQTAWLAMWIIRAQGGKKASRITPEKLLGRKPARPDDKERR